MKKIYLIILTMFMCVACSGSDFTSTRNGGADALDEGAYLAERASFPTELEGEKVKVRVEGTITFPVSVKDIDPSDLIITNGRLKELTRTGKNTFTVVVIPIVKGDVTVQVPAGVVKSAFWDKPNEASKKITVNFKDYEVDSTLKIANINIATQPTSDPTKLVMILDNSGSRAGDQERLAENLRTSLDSLKDKNVELFVYSTTLFNNSTIQGENPGAAGRYKGFNTSYTYGTSLNSYMYNGLSDYNSYRQTAHAALKSSAVFIKNDNGQRVETIFTKSPFLYYAHDEIEETYFLAPSVTPIDFKSDLGGIKLNATDNTELQQEKLAAIQNMIKDFGDKGAINELPLCTLAMSILNDGPNKIFEKDDKVAFMIVTDEDQTSVQECPIGSHTVVETNEYMTINPGLGYLAFFVTYMHTTTDDKGVDALTERRILVGQKKECLVNGVNECLTGLVDNKRSCDSTEYEKHTKYSKVTGPVVKCEATWGGGAWGTVGVPIKNDKNYNKDSTNFQALVDGEEITVTDQTLSEFLSAQQDPSLVMAGSIVPARTSAYKQISSRLNMLPGVEEAGNLGKLIKLKADALFGRSNYTFAAISNKGTKNPNSSECSASIDQESVEINSIMDKTISICENDYSSIFDWFKNFVNLEAVVTYTLPDNVEDFVGVSLFGSDDLLMEDMYILEDNVLTFTDKSILKFGNDEIFTIRFREE